MRILYVAPNINHHQVPLAKEIVKLVGVENFRYATPMLIEESRKKMGWSFQNEPWIYPITKDNWTDFESMFLYWEVVICSIRDYHDLMSKRLGDNKLTFYYTERWFKTGIGELNIYIKGISKLRLLHPRFAKIVLAFRKFSKNPNFYFLAQSLYAAKDFKFLGLCKNRIYNWGYFTETKPHLPEKTFLPTNKINILWCGRMLIWKRVEILIKAFVLAHKQNKEIYLTIVGEGPEKINIEKLAKKLLPTEAYRFIPFIPAQDVRKVMHEADIYVLPSSGFEGWGAVVNEAMAESTVVIGSDQAGAVKTIIRHGENGFIFHDGDYKQLAKILIDISSSQEKRSYIKGNAKKDIEELWSPKVAAGRLIDFCQSNLESQDLPKFDKGTMMNIG